MQGWGRCPSSAGRAGGRGGGDCQEEAEGRPQGTRSWQRWGAGMGAGKVEWMEVATGGRTPVLALGYTNSLCDLGQGASSLGLLASRLLSGISDL